MKTLTRSLLLLGLISSMSVFAKKHKEITVNIEGSKDLSLDSLNCKQAYEKARGKRYHKRLLHGFTTKRKAQKELNAKVTKSDVERAIAYGYRTGAYCESGRILSKKEFKKVTIQKIEEIRAVDAKEINIAKEGEEPVMDTLENRTPGEKAITCKYLVKMSKSSKEDGHNRSIVGLKKDMHNIYTSYEKTRDGVELKTKQERKLEKRKNRYMRRVLKDSIKDLDDDSITMADVNRALEASIEDGSACSEDKVLNRKQMKDLIAHKLSSSPRVESVNGDDSQLQKDINIFFNNGGEIKGIDELEAAASKT